MLTDIWNWLKAQVAEEPAPLPVKKPRRKHKKPDHYEFTEMEVAFIKRQRKAYADDSTYKDIHEFVACLNDVLGRDKSLREYQRIWSGWREEQEPEQEAT